MTDKQSTVVVSRELAELCAQCLMNSGYMQQHSELRTLLAATPEPEQAVDVGEPYAWAYSHTGFVEIPVNKPVITTERWPELYGVYSETPLYRHAQSPAKVLLPKQKGPSEYYDPVGTPYSMGWNACRDEVAKLNQCSEVDPQCSEHLRT